MFTSDGGLAFRIYKELSKLGSKTTACLKMGKRLEQTFSPLRLPRWHINRQVGHFIPVRTATVKTKKTMLLNKAQLECLYIVGANPKWYSPSRKLVGVSSEVQHFPYDPSISLLGVNFRKMKLRFPQKPVHKCS